MLINYNREQDDSTDLTIELLDEPMAIFGLKWFRFLFAEIY